LHACNRRVSSRLALPDNFSIHQHTSAYVSIRQHTSRVLQTCAAR
jgi:hypothetical protein